MIIKIIIIVEIRSNTFDTYGAVNFGKYSGNLMGGGGSDIEFGSNGVGARRRCGGRCRGGESDEGTKYVDGTEEVERSREGGGREAVREDESMDGAMGSKQTRRRWTCGGGGGGGVYTLTYCHVADIFDCFAKRSTPDHAGGRL